VATMTEEQSAIMGTVRASANALAESLQAAEASGIGQATLLPELIKIMRESGLLPEGIKIPFLGR
jgi:hypothetical protein